MKNIQFFNGPYEFARFCSRRACDSIGQGGEGIAYFTKTGDVLKVMDMSFQPQVYNPNEDILMDSDLKLESFIFPKELFVCGDKIVGYVTRYFPNNLFVTNDPFKEGNIDLIDIDALLKARLRMIEDIKVITDKGYDLFELPRNLLFDNKKLAAIDTLSYNKRNDITLEENIGTLDFALNAEFEFYNLPFDYDFEDSFEETAEKLKKYKASR